VTTEDLGDGRQSQVTDKPGFRFSRYSHNAFDFYKTYLSVIYGLLVTLGLTRILDFTKGEEETWDVLSISLFAGNFITVMRLWLSLANIDDVSRRAYRVTARSKYRIFNLLLLVDSVFATAFAGLLLAMFAAAPAVPSEASEFLLFLWLAGLNLGYAALSGSLFYGFSKFSIAAHEEAADQETRCPYKAKIRQWIKYNLVFLTAAIALYLLDLRLKTNSKPLALTFVLITAAQLVVEQLFANRNQGKAVG